MNRTAIAALAVLAFATTAFSQEEPRTRRGGIFRTPAMELPSALMTSDVEIHEGAAVRTLRNPFRFGRYEVKALKKGNLPSSQYGLTIGHLTAGSARARQRYSFELRDGGVPVASAECFWLAGSRGITHREKNSTTDLRLRQDVALRCSIDTDVEWTLELTTSVAPRMGAPDVQSEGFFTNGEQSVAVEASYRLDGTRLPAAEPTGYLFSDGEGALAAMERTGRGRLIMVPGLSDADRVALAAASAALFLQEQLSDLIED